MIIFYGKTVLCVVKFEQGIKKCVQNFVVWKLSTTFALANKHGAIAQLVEQRTENPCVPGSIPGGTTPFANYINKIYWCHSSVGRAKD